MTLEQIANWNSQRNPLENVYGKETISPTITTRVAESIGGVSMQVQFLYVKILTILEI